MEYPLPHMSMLPPITLPSRAVLATTDMRGLSAKLQRDQALSGIDQTQTVQANGVLDGGDSPPLFFKFSTSEPANGGVQSSDGSWWEPFSGGGPITPHSFGGVGDGVTDDTVALQAFFDYAAAEPAGTAFDYSGRWGVSDTITINVGDDENKTFICGSIEYLGGSDLDILVYIENASFCNFTGVFRVVGSGSVTYSTREVTDLIVTNRIPGVRFDGIWARYAKRHGIDLSGKPGDSATHIGADLGRCYFKECGAAAYTTDDANVREKTYDFTARTDSGGTTSTTQRSVLTIDGGIDVLDEGSVFRYNGKYHWIESVDSGAGTITVYPQLSNTATTGTLESSHGAAVRNLSSNSASMRIGGLKALGCGVGLHNQCLYGPHVSNLETQVVGVSYLQKGLCRGTVIDVFHPETPEGDVDILKCDNFDTDTAISGLSVQRLDDIINLFPTDPATGNETVTPMVGISINPDGVVVAAGQKTQPTVRRTSIDLSNKADTDPVIVRNRTSTTVSLERDEEIARLFGCTSVTILRLGDSSNLAPGGTVIQPTSAEVTAGVTVMGGSSYTLPALPEGTLIICDLDTTRDDWRVYTYASAMAPPGGTTANRPTLPSGSTGFQYFDTTLGHPIWHDGTNWVDATGTTA